MKNVFTTMLITFGLKPALAETPLKDIYSFKVKNIDGQEVQLDQFKGQVIMIVNVASKCGFTNQYEGLEKLNNTYKKDGFVVLGFPANDFGNQEPGSEAEIKQFCRLTYSVDFPMFAKVAVKGEEIHPLFKFLTEEANKKETGAVLWNFEKFLLNRQGQLVERYRSTTKPESKKIINAIEKLLKEKV